MLAYKFVSISIEGCVPEINASIPFRYDAVRVSANQTESNLTAHTDMKIIPYDKIKVNLLRFADFLIYHYAFFFCNHQLVL